MTADKLCCCLLLSALVVAVNAGPIVNAMHMKLIDDNVVVNSDVVDEASVLQLEGQNDVTYFSDPLDDVNRKACYDTNQCIAFSAVRRSNLNNTNGKLPFDDTLVNEGNPFNLQTNEFVPPTKGFYWLHWSVGLKNTAVDVRLEGGPRSPSVIRYYIDLNEVDITSRDELVWLNGNKDTLYLSSDFDLSSYYSDSKGLQTSFSGFCLSSTMKPFVGFSVGLSSILSKTGKIPFDIVNVDTHKGWQAQAFEYRAPKKGSYILSLSIGTYANVDVRVGLYVGQKFIAGMFEAGRYSDKIGEVTISKTIIAQAAENAPIFAALETAGAKLYSDYHYHTSLMGFLYVPAGITSIAWSVATTRTTMSTDPVSFETVLVNEGNGWKTDTKRFVAPEGGVYYIQLSTGRSSATWRYYSTINSAEVLVNGSPVMNVYAANIRESYYWYDSYSPLGQASRALVVRLRAGDELRVRVPNLPRVYDEAVYSNSYRLTSFSGFRIYA